MAMNEYSRGKSVLVNSRNGAVALATALILGGCGVIYSGSRGMGGSSGGGGLGVAGGVSGGGSSGGSAGSSGS